MRTRDCEEGLLIAGRGDLGLLLRDERVKLERDEAAILFSKSAAEMAAEDCRYIIFSRHRRRRWRQ